MKTIKKVVVSTKYIDTVPENKQEGVIYISKKYMTSIHNCLCGCKEEVVMPLGNNGWQLIEHDSGTISFTPSIGNYQFACKSHYIITKGIANFI